MTDQARAARLLSSLDTAMQTTFSSAIVKYWPLNYRSCTAYSLLAAPILRVGLNDPMLRVVVGTYKDNDHCWVKTGDEWIIDPTLGQFEPQRGFRWAIWSPEHTNCLDRYHVDHILDLDEEDLCRRTITTDGATKIKDDFWSPDSKT